jgi:hypothetical protein
VQEDREETISTLLFGTRAKSIRNVVHINKEMSPDELRSKVDALLKARRVLGLLGCLMACLSDAASCACMLRRISTFMSWRRKMLI